MADAIFQSALLLANIGVTAFNLGILGLSFKLYTEIMKEKAQRERGR